MSNLSKKTKKELIDIILRKDDKELELNQTIDSKQAVIDSLEEELKNKQEIISSLENELKINKNIIAELNTIKSNYAIQLTEADEAIDNYKQLVNDTKKYIKQVNRDNKTLSILNLVLIISLAIAIFC